MNVSSIVRQQRAFFKTGATRSLEFRTTQLRKLLDAILENESALLGALGADLRKSPHDAYLGEVGMVLSEIRHALGNLPLWMKRRRCSVPWIGWPGRGFVQPEPYGVVLIIGPWNYPLQLVLMPLVGAIAAGNCAVLKPSEFTPHSASALAGLVRENFSMEYITVVEGASEVSEALLQEKFDKIFFTGSSKVGRAVMAAAANHLTPVTLELGGKCPCIVCADAPLSVTARRIVWGKFMNAGQTCVAPDYVLVDARVYEDLLEAMKQALNEFYGLDPQQSPNYGRIVNRKHFDRLTGYLKQGSIYHGGQNDARDLYIAPTILTDVSLDSPLMHEEIFGPILPVIKFEDLNSALVLVGERPAPLAVYLFTNNRFTRARVVAGTRSGGVCVNDTILQIMGKDLPFGGLEESGMGAYHGKTSFDCFTHYRSVLERPFWPDFRLRYRPVSISLITLKRISRLLMCK